jgi:hypothetical protein
MNQPLSERDQARLTHEVMRILRSWQLDHDAQVALLGLPEDTKPRAMARHGRESSLPYDAERLTRARYLLEIDHALAAAFPHNPDMAGLWVTTSSPRFGGGMPLDLMLRNGMEGMRRVLEHLHGGDSGWQRPAASPDPK